MDKVVTVAVREFVETVKTKAFLLSTVFMPMLIMGAIGAGQWITALTEQEQLPPRKIAVVDRSGVLADVLAQQVAAYNAENPNKPFELLCEPAEGTNVEALAELVRHGDVYAYLLIPADVLDRSTACELGRKDSQFEPGRRLQEMLNEAIWSLRFSRAALDRAQIQALMQPVPLTTLDVQTGEQAAGDDVARLLTPFGFMFLLFMGTFGISQGLLTSVIEEKSSRVIEVLLSALSPTQLMAGKILGMVAVGALLLGVWGTVGFFGAQARDAGYLVTGYRLTYVALYFVPGFLLISAFLAAVGSACNTLKEAQGMVFPLSVVTIVPMVFWWQISQNPSSALSVVLSYIPPITPFVMILRICVDPATPVWQIVTTLLVLWAAVFFVVWAAGKVFRVGVLMYGKPPTLRELARWVRCA